MNHPPTPVFDQLLTTAASWLLIGCACWAGVICTAAVVEAATNGRLRATNWVCCPAPLRRILLAGLGVALVGVPGAAAGVPMSRSTDGPGVTAATRQRTLPVPARPLGTARLLRVVVRPGDTLWHLAEVRLPASAPDAGVADLVASVHRRNREVIGPDPDLIRPGQRLTVPTLPNTRSRAEPTPRGEP